LRACKVGRTRSGRGYTSRSSSAGRKGPGRGRSPHGHLVRPHPGVRRTAAGRGVRPSQVRDDRDAAPVASSLLEESPGESLEGAHPPLDPGVEEEAAARRSRTGSQPLGAAAIRGQHPHDRPKRPKKSPAPLFHAVSSKVRHELWEAYAWFVAAFQDAAEKLRAGDRHAAFPAGSFPPAFRGRVAPLQVARTTDFGVSFSNGAGARCAQRTVSAEGNLPKSTVGVFLAPAARRIASSRVSTVTFNAGVTMQRGSIRRYLVLSSSNRQAPIWPGPPIWPEPPRIDDSACSWLLRRSGLPLQESPR